VIGYRIGMASWLEERSEKTAIDEGGDIQCDKEVVLEKSKEETKSGAADWRVEEKMGSPDTREDMQCDKEIALKRTEEGDEKITMNEGGDVRCAEEIILEESEEEAEHGVDRIVGSGITAMSRLVEKKEMGIPDPREDARHDKDVVLKRKRDRPRDMEEVRQQGVEDKGTKKRDKERSKVRDGQETSEMLGSLTKKGGQRCPQHIEMSLQVTKKELIKERPCRSSTKNSRNCVDISSVQRSVEWECRGYMPTIKRRSASSGLSLSESTVNRNRDRGMTDSGTEGPLTSSTKVGKGVRSIRAQQNPWRRCRWTGEEVGKHQEVSQGSHDL